MQASSANCPSRDALACWVVGRLRDSSADSVSAHVEGCPACQAALESLERIRDPLVVDLRGPVALATAAPGPELEPLLRRAQGIAVGATSLLSPTVALEAIPRPPLPPLPQRLRDYQLLEVLGEGGMGRVYKALHTKLNRLVALKVLPAERLKNSEALNRFRREMRAIGRLDHPHLVRASDAGEIDGLPFLAMELVEGVDVGRLVAGGERLPSADACEIVRQAALALQYIHEHGLIHRDVKPSNLMLTPGGQVKLLDLGVALLREGDVGAEPLTDTGYLVGTVDYMAPEQINYASRVDIRADIYSLGCTLYRLLTGRVAFPEGTAFQKLDGHKHHQPVSAAALRPDLLQPLVEILNMMLAKRPEQRPQTPAQLADLLAPFSRGARLTALLTRTTSRLPERPERTTEPKTKDETRPAWPTPPAAKTPWPRSVLRPAALWGGIMLVLGGLVTWSIVALISGSGGSAMPAGGGVDTDKTAKKDTNPGPIPEKPAEKGKTPEPPEAKKIEVRAEAVLPGHMYHPQLVAFARNGAWAVSTGNMGGEVVLWDLKNHKKSTGWIADRTPHALTVLADGTIAVSRGWYADLYAPGAAKAFASLEIPKAHELHDLAASPDKEGRYLAGAGSDGTVIVWAAKGLKVQEFSHGAAVLSVAFSADATLLVTGTKNKLVQLWDVKTGKSLGVLEGHTGEVCKVAFSADGQHIISVGRGSEGDQNKVRVWDRKDLTKKPRTFDAPGGATQTCVAFSMDGRFALTGCRDGMVILWEPMSGKTITAFEGHKEGVLTVAFSADGRRVLSGGNDQLVRLWELHAPAIPAPKEH